MQMQISCRTTLINCTNLWSHFNHKSQTNLKFILLQYFWAQFCRPASVIIETRKENSISKSLLIPVFRSLVFCNKLTIHIPPNNFFCRLENKEGTDRWKNMKSRFHYVVQGYLHHTCNKLTEGLNAVLCDSGFIPAASLCSLLPV